MLNNALNNHAKWDLSRCSLFYETSSTRKPNWMSKIPQRGGFMKNKR